MPLGYGSQYVGVKLTSEEIATELYQTPSSSFGVTGFLRILLTIAEIGAAFIPGLGVIEETAFGVAAGIGNEILDVQEGNANVASSLLNIGSPFIGGAFSGARNLAKVGNFEYGIISGIESEGVGNALEAANAARVGGTLSGFNYGVKGAFATGTNEVGQSVFRKAIADTLDLPYTKLGEYLPEFTKSIVESAGDISFKITDNLIRDGVDDERFGKFLSKTGLSAKEIDELKELLKFARTFDEQRSILLGFIRDLGEANAKKFYANVTGEIATVFKNQAWQLPLARKFADEYDTIVDGMLAVRLNRPVVKKGMMSKIVSYLGSARFNDRWVQKIQAIFDPNDLGRAGIEALYKETKGFIRTYFKSAEKIIAGADKIEDAFVASGGKLVESDWHMGYKVVKDLGIGSQLVMIQFKAAESNGKRPVLVLATDAELARYIASPGKTYLRLWSYSRGGKNLGLGKLFGASSVFRLGRQATSILGFLPVQALRNVLSLVSNVVENTADMSNGSYFLTYQKKFVSSLTRSAVSRTFRLAGRVVLGGVATQYFGRALGNFIGREAQRIGTNVFAKGIQNVIAGKAFSNGLTQRVETGALTSIRGNMLRRLRNYNPNSVIVNSLSARRKLYQIKRIPNAFVPGRPWKGIKL